MVGERRGQLTKRNLILGTADGVLATPWVFLSLPGGFIMTALIARYFGVGPGAYGLIVALPALANAFQVLYMPVLNRFLSPRDMALGPAWMNVGIWLLFGSCLGLLPVDDTAAVTGFLIVFFIFSSFCSSLVGVGWSAWVQSWVPGRVRGKYFGRRNLFIQITTVGFLLFAMLMLKLSEGKLWGFQVIILLATGLRLASVLWQHLIVQPLVPAAAPLVKRGWFGRLLDAWRHRPLRIYMIFMGWTAFWMSAFGPFSVLFAFQHAGVSEVMFAQITILATLTGAVMMPFWGRMIDRHGGVRVVSISLFLWWLTGYVWVILTPENNWLLYFSWFFGGAASGGFLLGAFTLLYRVLPPGLTTVGVSLNMSLTSIAAAAGPIVIGKLLAWLAVDADWETTAYRVLFALATTVILATSFFARKIPESAAVPPSTGVLGAMRSLRLNMAQFGYGFINNTHQFWRHRSGRNDKPDQ